MNSLLLRLLVVMCIYEEGKRTKVKLLRYYANPLEELFLVCFLLVDQYEEFMIGNEENGSFYGDSTSSLSSVRLLVSPPSSHDRLVD